MRRNKIYIQFQGKIKGFFYKKLTESGTWNKIYVQLLDNTLLFSW